MAYFLSLILGYLMGAFNPAALLARRKNVDLKATGTKNLGASNALIVLGRSAGAIVMVLDILKAWLAAKLASALFRKFALVWAVAALGAILGHVFPFHLHFSGGKGLAAFGGMVCAYSPWLLVFYLTVGVVLMLLVNRSVFLPMFAAATFPVIVYYQTRNGALSLICLAASALIAWKHWSNIGKVERGEEAPVRDVFRKKVFKH